MASRIWRWNGTTMVEVSPWAFTKVAVSGQSDVVADQESDTLSMAGSGGVTLTTDATGDSVTVTIGAAPIIYTYTGVAPPTITTARSIGTRIVLADGFVAGSAADYAIGIESGAIWMSVAVNAAGASFKWYGSTTLVGQLSGVGNLILPVTTGVSSLHTVDVGAWDGNSSYAMVKMKGQAAGTYMLLSSGGTTTYISTHDANGSVIIRPGINSTTYQWVFSQAGTHSAVGTQFTFRPTAADNGIKINGGSIYCYSAATALTTMNSQNTLEGMSYVAGAYLSVAGASTNPLIANRITTDGNVVLIQSLGVTQGIISVAGTTTTYAAFCGAHWSQLIDNAHPDILRGTVMDTIDEMCEWPDEDNDQLAKVKVSDTPGSRRVYGVFMRWDDPKGENEAANDTNDMYVAAIGAWLIRVAAGVTVAGGDLLESNGDGCARVQGDDLFRSSTIAKVTSTTVIETHPDGSYLVPCTLHCG